MLQCCNGQKLCCVNTAEATEEILKVFSVTFPLCPASLNSNIACYKSVLCTTRISSQSLLMPKDPTKSKPAAAAKASKRAAQSRTMTTRPGNANKNPLDLEVVTSEEDKPKAPTKRKKLVKRTQDEIEAGEEKKSKVLASIGRLEEDMARQVSVNDRTPHALSARLSYVAPDPPAAFVKPASSRGKVIAATEDDSDEEIRPAKKARPIRDQVDNVKLQREAEKARKAKAELKMVSNLTTAQRSLMFSMQAVDPKPPSKAAEIDMITEDSEEDGQDKMVSPIQS